MYSRKPQRSVTHEVLKALIPYTEQNLKLVFKPALFFRDLERITQANRQTLATTLSRAKKRGLVEMENETPVLTSAGLHRIEPVLLPPLLNEYLLVAFDIPESRRYARNQFRAYLRSKGFRQLQKSLWISRLDYSQQIYVTAWRLRISKEVRIFRANIVDQG